MGGIGSGAKPREYPEEVVNKIRELYDSGMTQDEIAAKCGTRQKKIWKIMKRYGIKARVAAKRDQRGEKNHSWKGENATYAANHYRVEAVRGKPMKCELCETEEEDKWYDWANLTGRHHDPSDYVRLCRSCHRLSDNRGLLAHLKRKEGSL